MRRVEGYRPGIVLLTALFCWALQADDSSAQTHLQNRDFLNLGAAEDYLNYGRKEYDPYPKVITARNKYDRLGNFQMRGYKVFEWELSQPGYSEIDTRRTQYLGWFQNLIILNDSYRGWNYAATIGEDIRTTLTDLTMKDPRWYGLRLDGASSDNRFTLLMSQGGAQANNPKFSTFQNTKERSSVFVFGGRWETQLGSVLRIGTTYFNQHMTDTFNENGSFFKGDTPYSMLPPSYIQVVVADDSPATPNTAAYAYGVDIVITGERQGQPIRMTSLDGDPDYDPLLEAQVSGGRFATGGGRQAGGQGEQIVYEFNMPGFDLPDPAGYASDPDTVSLGITVRSVRFLADVAGDYRLMVRQRHLVFDPDAYEGNIEDGYVPGDRRYENPYTGLSGDEALWTAAQAEAAGEDVFNHWPVRPDPNIAAVNPFLEFQWDLEDPTQVAYTVARSDGHSADASNRHIVEFDYGIPTGQSLYGLDWELRLKGLTVTGEFTANPQHFIFPVGSNAGDRFDKRPYAYFVNALKEWRGLSFGGELFQLDADYSGNYDSQRGGIPFFTDHTSTGFSAMQEMYVMADNDDNDQWPDEFINELPSAEKIDSGIYPGLDENMDLIPDTDQNTNGVPDWTEPIIFYDADPPEFVYGIDFNNNGVVDFRENDARPDYPYQRDRKGRHGFITADALGPFGEWLSVGIFDLEEVAGGGDARSLYGRYEYRSVNPYYGRLQINADVKLVEDSIRDDVYVWRNLSDRRIPSPYPHLTGREIEERDLNSQLLPPDPDPLTMRNSFVNTLFIRSRYGLASDLDVVNTIKWSRNAQREDEFDDGTAQPENTLSFIAMVNKGSYTLRLGNLTVRPMFKHLVLREHSQVLEDETGKGDLRSFSIYSPVLRSKWTLTPKSSLEMGFQGFPFWRYRMLDRVDEEEDFKEWTFLIMLTNRSDYYGYNLASQFGWMTTERTYDRETRRALNQDNSALFFDIVAGF